MVLHILRALFVLLMAAAGWAYLEVGWLAMSLALGVAVLLSASTSSHPAASSLFSPARFSVCWSGR